MPPPIKPIKPTNRTRTPGALGVTGPVSVLEAAYRDDTPVTITHGHAAGEPVYLGHRQQCYGDAGITVETIGHDHTLGYGDRIGEDVAVYLVDQARLDAAPVLAEIERQRHARAAEQAAEMERRVQAEEDDYLAEPDG